MRKLKILQKDYTSSCLYYQIKLPLDLEIIIPSDDPVRLLSAFVEGMELSDLYKTYGKIKKGQASPRQLFKIVIYAGMNRIYSSRDIESACRRDVNFMYLLEGKPAPDHATIARFISLHLSRCSKTTLAEVTNALYELGEISGRHIFIDGTKIESAANKYTFVWKKAVTKNQARLMTNIAELISECEQSYGLKLVYNDCFSLHSLKRIRKKLYAVKDEEGISFAHGIGKRKTQLQRSIEKLEAYIEKLKEYTKKLHICGERNSFPKTDPDATFMRMKEDAMLNGQLSNDMRTAINNEDVKGFGALVSRLTASNPDGTVARRDPGWEELFDFEIKFEEYLKMKNKNMKMEDIIKELDQPKRVSGRKR